MGKLKSSAFFVARYVVMGVCGLISAFLLMAGYEAVFNKSLPLVHTIDPINLSALNSSYDLPSAAALQQKRYGSFGKPETVKLPERSARFNVVDPINQDSEWLSRTNAMHLMLPTQARSGNIGVALMYCRAGFRTIDASSLPQVGSNIFVDTDEQWRYVYKVTAAKVFPQDLPYIASDTGTTSKLVIVCNDGKTKANIIVEATLLSVQGVAS